MNQVTDSDYNLGRERLGLRPTTSGSAKMALSRMGSTVFLTRRWTEPGEQTDRNGKTGTLPASTDIRSLLSSWLQVSACEEPVVNTHKR